MMEADHALIVWDRVSIRECIERAGLMPPAAEVPAPAPEETVPPPSRARCSSPECESFASYHESVPSNPDSPFPPSRGFYWCKPCAETQGIQSRLRPMFFSERMGLEEPAANGANWTNRPMKIVSRMGPVGPGPALQKLIDRQRDGWDGPCNPLQDLRDAAARIAIEACKGLAGYLPTAPAIDWDKAYATFTTPSSVDAPSIDSLLKIMREFEAEFPRKLAESFGLPPELLGGSPNYGSPLRESYRLFDYQRSMIDDVLGRAGLYAPVPLDNRILAAAAGADLSAGEDEVRAEYVNGDVHMLPAAEAPDF